MLRGVLSLVLAALAILLALPTSASMADEPTYRLGFKALADLIPVVAGTPLEDEHHNPLNGDGLQMTSNGLMVWRKADNWTAFTNGFWTWVNGPYGLQDRSNLLRFDWEADAPRMLELQASPTVTPTPGPDSALPGGSPTAAPLPFPTIETAVSLPTVTWTPTATPYLEPTSTAYAQPTSTSYPTAIPTSTPVPTATAIPTAVPTRTPVPTAVPTSTTQPTATRTPTSAPTVKPTATQPVGGVRSPDPAGDWVTSVSANTLYYCSKDSTYWKSWSSANRIWFPSEASLLAAYPGRVKHD